jgi:phosphatidylserine synthase
MKGVPTPISAITLISYVAFALALWDDRAPQWLAALVVISVSLLMVSNLKFESNSISRPRDLGESWKILPFALSILSVIVYGPAALFLFALLYISIGLIRWVLEHRPRPDEATAF